MMIDDLHGQVGLPLLPFGQCCCYRTLRTLVVAGGRDLQQSCHSGDRGGRALCGHQLEPVYFGWLAAKYAEAFFRNAMSFSCSATCLRRRASSVRSAAVNGTSSRAAAGLDAAPLLGAPPPQQGLIHAQFASDLGDRAPGIDHPMSGFDLVFGRERPAGSGHGDILPAGPFIPLSRCPPSGGSLRLCSRVCRPSRMRRIGRHINAATGAPSSRTSAAPPAS